MALITITTHTAVCGACGAMQDAEQVTRHRAASVLRNSGWQIGAERNLCPRCNPRSAEFDQDYRDIRTGARPPDF